MQEVPCAMQHRKLLTLLDNVRKTRKVFSSNSLAVTFGRLTVCQFAAPLNRPLAPSAIPSLNLKHAPAGVRCFAARSGGRFVRF